MTVVAGVDDSPVSKQVVARGMEQARWRKAELHLVHVAQAPILYTDAPIDWTEVIEAQRAAVWAQLEDDIAGSDVHVKKVDLDGYPPDALVEYAKEADAELLVVGTRGRGELAALILGSTSHRAIHLAECDVLVVKATR
ncbi:MAG TPA: universal stress protein [Acidimicrobiia bacterium]|nr:universal stress protein [Acidimicrobiia bacterium]